MRGTIISLLCIGVVLVTIVAFGHWEQQEGKHPPVTGRFTDNDDGTVTDKTTGLIWLKDANCFGPLTWDEAMTATAGLADGQCGLTDGSATGDWRLPERDALLSLINKGYKYPVLISNVVGKDQGMAGDSFSGVQPGPYWSATTLANYPDAVWLVYLGLYYDSVGYESKTRLHYVWPVRDGQENIRDFETLRCIEE
jgi:hypothetical protein